MIQSYLLSVQYKTPSRYIIVLYAYSLVICSKYIRLDFTPGGSTLGESRNLGLLFTPQFTCLVKWGKVFFERKFLISISITYTSFLHNISKVLSQYKKP